MKLERYEVFKWDVMNGKQAQEKVLDVISLLGKANRNYNKIPLHARWNQQDQKNGITKCWQGQGCGALGCSRIAGRNARRRGWKIVWLVLHEVRQTLPTQNPAIPLLGTYPRNKSTRPQKDTCVRFIAALCINSPKLGTTQRSTNRRMKKHRAGPIQWIQPCDKGEQTTDYQLSNHTQQLQ